MNLTVDLGNSSTKVAAFDGDVMVMRERLENDVLAAGLARIKASYDIEACACSLVGTPDTDAGTALRQVAPFVLKVTGTTPTPLACDYLHPETLGADRLAVAVGAATLMPGKAVLVVDAGTCITYEYVSADGHYLGGNISPGLGIRLRSLHDHTALLPAVSADGDAPEMGRDTLTAIRAGTVRGLEYEVEGYISRFRRQEPQGGVLVTGGNGRRLTAGLEVEYCDALVETGLNRILDFNRKRT